MSNKIKGFIVLFLIMFITTGCVNVNKADTSAIVTSVLNSKYSLYNTVRQGFKYYLPRGLSSTRMDISNEYIKSSKYDYYLYVDLVAYFNKVAPSYSSLHGNYYNETFNEGGIASGSDITGSINISKIDDKYLVQIHYNYAKIEVKVEYKDINEAISNSLIILSSIKYDDDVITNLLDTDVLSPAEDNIELFTVNRDDNSLVVDDSYDDEETTNATYDPDVINKKGYEN